MKPPSIQPSAVRIAAARLENEAADTGRPIRTGPPACRSHTSAGGSLSAVAPWQASPLQAYLRPIAKPAPARAPIADSSPGRGITAHDERSIFLSYSPPQFHIPKKGPNAGTPVEKKRRITIITRTVSDSYGNEYKFSTRSSAVTLTPLVGEPRKLTRSQVRETFARRFPFARAAYLTAFLLMED